MKRLVLFVLLLAVSTVMFGCGETVSGVGKLHLWDYAAGLILIREAGGVVRDLNGKDLELNIYEGVIAGNDRLVSEIEKSS